MGSWEPLTIQGPAGWGEFCPFQEYHDREAAGWLATAIEAATLGWPEPVRDRVPVNCTVPAVGPHRAHEIVSGSGCRTAKVKVADHPDALGEDLARLEAVRVDANGGQRWRARLRRVRLAWGATGYDQAGWAARWRAGG